MKQHKDKGDSTKGGCHWLATEIDIVLLPMIGPMKTFAMPALPILQLAILNSMSKRTDYISWDEYFMGVALLSGRRSKDPSTQVGACIVNDKFKIVGAGYNGLPIGLSDDEFPWGKNGDFLDTKYTYVCHAELNAILNNIGIDLHGCRIYTALFPCNECSKAIIQAGIKEVIYLSDKYAENDVFIASKKMLKTAGVSFRRVINRIDKIELSFNEQDV